MYVLIIIDIDTYKIHEACLIILNEITASKNVVKLKNIWEFQVFPLQLTIYKLPEANIRHDGHAYNVSFLYLGEGRLGVRCHLWVHQMFRIIWDAQDSLSQMK